MPCSAGSLGIALVEREIVPGDLLVADEVFLTSTSPCMLPVVALNGQPIGDGTPGPAFARLLTAWNGLVGLDISAQARRFAARTTN